MKSVLHSVIAHKNPLKSKVKKLRNKPNTIKELSQKPDYNTEDNYKGENSDIFE